MVKLEPFIIFGFGLVFLFYFKLFAGNIIIVAPSQHKFSPSQPHLLPFPNKRNTHTDTACLFEWPLFSGWERGASNMWGKLINTAGRDYWKLYLFKVIPRLGEVNLCFCFKSQQFLSSTVVSFLANRFSNLSKCKYGSKDRVHKTVLHRLGKPSN